MKYRIIQINTAWEKDPKLGGLSFVEGERDIPFAIQRIFCIYKTDENHQREFHAHKKSWQLLFCPYGNVDILLTEGEESETITLDNPTKGLVLNPGLCWEIIWRHDDSVLCVAASKDYGPDGSIGYEDAHFSHSIGQNLEYGPGTVGNVLDVKMLEFPSFGSDYAAPRSIVMESLKEIPFAIRRIFYIFGEGNVGHVRGKHANRKSEFVLFNISGRSKVKVIDEDLSETIYELNTPKDAVYLPRMIWKEMYDFTPDSVLMVVTNAYYDSGEYVRDFDAFVKEIREMKKNH